MQEFLWPLVQSYVKIILSACFGLQISGRIPNLLKLVENFILTVLDKVVGYVAVEDKKSYNVYIQECLKS